MRRDRFTLEVTDVAWAEAGKDPSQPTLTIRADGGSTPAGESPLDEEDLELDSSEVDVTFRLKGDSPEEPGDGVMAVTDRVTGEYLLELDVDAGEILTFVTAARRYGEHTSDTARYRLRVVDGEEVRADIEKRTLLVYAGDGELLRQHSLIPSGVEI